MASHFMTKRIRFEYNSWESERRHFHDPGRLKIEESPLGADVTPIEVRLFEMSVLLEPCVW